MSLHFHSEIRTLQKLYPLTISRGTMSSSDNLFVTLSDGTHAGIGEHAPATGKAWTAERGQTQLKDFVASQGVPESPFDLWQAMKDAEIDPPAMAALDIALWDLLAKQGGLPLYRLLGLPKRAVPTSVTIGINPPEVTRERVPDILRTTGAKCLKIKLGSPEGRDHDKEHFMAAKESSDAFGVKLRVDANGGWTVAEAIDMIAWLAERGVDYVEQPLAEGHEAGLPEVFAHRKLPIFVDESCRFSSDIPKWAAHVDGVNLKLMKCGGVTEALRIVATARAHGLQTMIGCMSESSIAIAAGAAMSALFDYIDLDSHLNLNPDPASGAEIHDGLVLPNEKPGHGAALND
ncbi:MAG: dipeptide epimerase [Armatimonadetes bacterium]|nr:dipeptide epimerase [Armatimonadota bacterium]